MAVSMDGEDQPRSELWMKYLKEELQEFDKHSIDEDVTIILWDVLMENDVSEVAIKQAALQLDAYEKNVCLSYDPIETMVLVARLIPHDSALRHRLIQLLHELIKTPTASDYSDALSGILEKDWNDIFPNMQSFEDEKSRADWKQKCDQWLNFSTFKARTLAAGICANDPNWSLKAPLKDISIGLGLRDDIWGDDIFTNCVLMVAAQYIIIAGEGVRSRFTEEKEEPGSNMRLNQHLWKLWTERLQEASNSENFKAKTKDAAVKAYKKLKELWPEISPDAEVRVKQGVVDPTA